VSMKQGHDVGHKYLEFELEAREAAVEWNICPVC
jgi:hypothetical protein